MPVTYRVIDWEKHFEKSQLKNVKVASWVPVPNKHDGKGFRRLMRQKNGIALFGAWVLILEVASKCPIRGTLADASGHALTADDLADKTDGPAKIFEEALNMLCSKEIGWIEAIGASSTLERAPSALLDTRSTLEPEGGTVRTAVEPQDRTGNGMEGKDKEDRIPPPEVCSEPPCDSKPAAIMSFPVTGLGGKEWDLAEFYYQQLAEAFPGVDLMAELRKARLWCVSNPAKRKTPNGMMKFLSSWLGRAQNESGRPQPYSKGVGHGKRDEHKHGAGQVHDPEHRAEF